MSHFPSERKAGVSAPGPSYMSKHQMGLYLNDLRTTRIPRPNGSRPLPASSTKNEVTFARPDKDLASSHSLSAYNAEIPYTKSRNLIIHSTGVTSRNSCGRDSLQGFTTLVPIESQERMIEREEAHYLRLALQKESVDDEDAMIASAQKEAAELIRRHERPNDPYSLEETAKELNAYLESTNVRRYGSLCKSTGVRSASNSRNSSSGSSSSNYSEEMTNNSQLRSVRIEGRKSAVGSERRTTGSLLGSSIKNLKNRRRSSGSRSNTNQLSHHGIFINPEDKIYEDPEDSSSKNNFTIAPPTTDQIMPERRNPFMRRRTSRQSLPTFFVKLAISTNQGKLTSDDGQIPNPALVTVTKPGETPERQEDIYSKIPNDSPEIRYKNGIEVRNDEIRAATSMSFKDRSPRLPMPVVVTDNPSRPIVSFNQKWTSNNTPESQLSRLSSESRQSLDGAEKIGCNIMSIPRNGQGNGFDSEIVSINSSQSSKVVTATDSGCPDPILHEVCMPSVAIDSSAINPSGVQNNAIEHREEVGWHSMAPQRQETYPLDSPSQTRTSPYHGSPNIRRQTALCAQCALPISGRIVTAAGTRFHPECFNCFHCSEGLECVAFYPEPEERRIARLERIQRRINGDEIEDDSAFSADEDGDDSQRFYCHLDFHELFSPRCKNCKTPIEGEIIQACGAEWHVGHFFCAQCGDPFHSDIPFVEKDGYAWCINCHTNRYSAKCKQCRKPVTGMVVNALGAEWHDECFCCTECGGKFESGQYFLRDENPGAVCVRCEERRLKSW